MERKVRTTKYYELKRNVEGMQPATEIQTLLRDSLSEILATGRCRTFKTKDNGGFDNWTPLVCQYLYDCCIKYEVKHGSNEIYVEVTMPAFLRDLKKEQTK